MSGTYIGFIDSLGIELLAKSPPQSLAQGELLVDTLFVRDLTFQHVPVCRLNVDPVRIAVSDRKVLMTHQYESGAGVATAKQGIPYGGRTDFPHLVDEDRITPVEPGRDGNREILVYPPVYPSLVQVHCYVLFGLCAVCSVYLTARGLKLE